MDVEENKCPAKAASTPTIQPIRRFSSEHIRKQPEYQFLKSGLYEKLIRTSIDACDYANRIQPSTVVEGKGTSAHPGTVTGSQRADVHGRKLPRPTTAGTIKIVQKVDKMYSSITVMNRPKTSVGFCSAPKPEQEGKESLGKISRISSGVCRKSSGLQEEDRKCFYDPDLEKSRTYLHKKNDMFTGANQFLTPARPGLSNLQLHYTDINTTHNDGVIFAHLLQSAHKKNALIGDGVYGLERRLYTKRAEATTWTTFWDRENVVRQRGSKCKPARNLAQRRKEKISEQNERMKMVFVPRARSLVTPTSEEMEELRHNCRYLRIHPKFQEHLYKTGLEFYGQHH